MYYRLSLFTLLIVSIISACSSTGTTTSSTSSSSSLYPAWYNASGFETDSTSFHAYGTAIAGDSLASVEKATVAAQLKLEKDLSDRLEDIRSGLEAAGNTDVKNTDYFIIFHEAQDGLSSGSTIQNVDTRKEGNTYRSVVRASLNKSKAKSHLEKGFTGHPRYWGALSGADTYKLLFN